MKYIIANFSNIIRDNRRLRVKCLGGTGNVECCNLHGCQIIVEIGKQAKETQ